MFPRKVVTFLLTFSFSQKLKLQQKDPKSVFLRIHSFGDVQQEQSFFFGHSNNLYYEEDAEAE